MDPRHETLRATVGWSYDLLDDWLKVLFCRSGVFAGGFTREAAERVLAFDGLDALDVADGLAELVDKSMLQVTDGRTGRRYRMLETMRQFGADLLDSAERRQNQVHFVDFYGEWCPATDRLLKGSDVSHAIRGLRDEFDNIREAFRLAMEQDRLDLAAEIVATLIEFSSRAVVGEPCVWAEELSERIRPEDHLYSDVMTSAIWGCRGRGDRQRAEELVAAYEQSESEGRFEPSAASDAYIGVTYWFWRRTDRSVALQERAIDKARADATVFNVVEHLARIDDPEGAAIALGALASATAAPSDDLISRAMDRLRSRLVDQLRSTDREVAGEERGSSMRLADLLRFLHDRLSEHADSGRLHEPNNTGYSAHDRD